MTKPNPALAAVPSESSIGDSQDVTTKDDVKKDPVAVEAAGDDTIALEFDGTVYAVPADVGDLDGDYLEYLESGRWTFACRVLLGDLWPTFKATKPKVRDYQKLIHAYHARLGLATGE